MKSDKKNHASELHDVNLRATPARLTIMKLLASTEKPVDVETILAYLKKQNVPTDPATAFRIMNVLTEKGLTKQVSFHEGKLRYELANRADHHHLICVQCGKIEDISDCNITALEKDIKQKKKFLVQYHSLEFFGLCTSCQKKLQTESS